MKILLADDDTKIHVIVKPWLSKIGHHVDTAHNGREAIEKLTTERYDGLISDVNMPVMRGIELVQRALELPEPLQLIMMLTARCDRVELRRKLDLPRVHVFTKPFSPATLANRIAQLSNQQPDLSTAV